MTNELYYFIIYSIGIILFIGGLLLGTFEIRGKCKVYDENGTCTQRSNDPMSTQNGSIIYILSIIMLVIGTILLLGPLTVRIVIELFGL
jgi:hypothetical protein